MITQGTVANYTQLTRRGQIRRLRRLAGEALTEYGIAPTSLSLLNHAYNTAFAVRGLDGSRYVLRIHRVSTDPTEAGPVDGARSPSRIESELWWLNRLRADLGVSVPCPIRTLADEEVVRVARLEGGGGVPEPRLCVLFHWMNGRFLDHRLHPTHLEGVGRLTAQLHEYSSTLEIPPGFDRQRVDKADERAEEFVARLFTDHWSKESAQVMRTVLRQVRRVQEELGQDAGRYGLIHGDIHQENYLFDGGALRLIDFDDCGWGHYLYDLAVTIHEVDYLPRGAELRQTLLDGYRQVRALSPADEARIHTFYMFYMLRELQITTWFLQERDNPSFGHWAKHVGYGVAMLDRLIAS